MTELTEGKPSAIQSLVADFKALSAKQWAGIAIALIVSLVLELYFSTSCFGFFIVAVILYMIPHLLGVSSVKIKAVVGVVFILLALPMLTFVFSGTLATAHEQLDGMENDYISDLEFNPETGEASFSVTPYIVDGNEVEGWEIVFQSYALESLTVSLQGDRSTLFEERFDPKTLTLGEDGLYHVTTSAISIDTNKAYVMGAYIVTNETTAVENLNILIDNNANPTTLGLVGAAYTVLYAAVIYFIITLLSAVMRRGADKSRQKMEAQGRLYPQGYGRCKQCGAMVLPGEINCRKCGAYIDVPDELRVKKKDFFQCSECGAEVPSDAKVCPKCGAKFDEADENVVVHQDGTEDVSTENVTCPECGSVVPANADWCPKCGKMLK